MALDYIQIGLGLFVFMLYLLSIFLLINIRSKLKGNSRIAFTFFIISIFVVAIRRLQQTFVNSKILFPVPYSAEIVTILFALTFFLGVLYLQKSIKSHDGESKGRSAASVMREYKNRFG